jgi:hypothetical protein
MAVAFTDVHPCCIPLRQHAREVLRGHSVRVRWVLCAPRPFGRRTAPGEGPSPSVLLLVSVACPRSDSSAPSDAAGGHWRFVGVSLASCPRALSSLKQSPGFGVIDSNGMMEVACCWRPPPRSAAPQAAYRGSQVNLYGHDHEAHCAGPSSGVAPTMAGVTGWPRRPGMPGAPCPVGLGTLQVIHHVMPQPNTPSWRLVSSAGCLAGPCCSPRRVVCDAEAHGLMGYL